MTRNRLALLFCLAVATPALGDVAYTNFGPGDSFDLVITTPINSEQFLAAKFVPSISGNLTTIRLPIAVLTLINPGPQLFITLRASDGTPNGPILETWGLSVGEVGGPPPSAPHVLTSSVRPFLTAGTEYWLRLESSISPQTTGNYYWYPNLTGDQLQSISLNQGASWHEVAGARPTLEVNVATDRTFLVRYVANVNAVDSLINMTNTGANGAMPFGPGIGPQAGNICVNVYAFSPDEQMVGCCSCHITPNGLASLSVYNDIRAITLTGLTPNSMVIKLVATATGGTAVAPSFSGGASACSQSAAGLNITHPVAADGLAAWTTTGHVPGLFPVPAAPPPFDITETAFTLARLSNQEITSLNNRCTAIIGNGSTFGTCRSCTLGGRGGSKF